MYVRGPRWGVIRAYCASGASGDTFAGFPLPLTCSRGQCGQGTRHKARGTRHKDQHDQQEIIIKRSTRDHVGGHIPKLWVTFPSCGSRSQVVGHIPKLRVTFPSCGSHSQVVGHIPKLWTVTAELFFLELSPLNCHKRSTRDQQEINKRSKERLHDDSYL